MALADPKMWRFFKLSDNVGSGFILNLLDSVFLFKILGYNSPLSHPSSFPHCQQRISNSSIFILFWKYLKNWKVHVRILWGLSKKFFHLIRLDAQKFRKESHTVNFRSSHRIRIVLWSDNTTEEGLNNKPTFIFTSMHYSFCHILRHSQVQVFSIQQQERAQRHRKIN